MSSRPEPESSHVPGAKSIQGDIVIPPFSDDRNPVLLYHHCMPAEAACFGVFEPDRRLSDPFFRMAYEWLEKEIGYYPVFFAVGELESALWMTGYDDNWRVCTGGERVDGTYRKTYRHKGEFPNLACFSFSEIDGILMDFQSWHIALNVCMNGGSVSEAERRMIFKPSWTRSRWLSASRKETHRVQLVAPAVPLHRAEHGYVRNSVTRLMLEKRGFTNIEVKRVKVER